jgi:hypothetical protein
MRTIRAGREAEAGTEAMEECCFLACSSWIFQPAFSLSPLLLPPPPTPHTPVFLCVYFCLSTPHVSPCQISYSCETISTGVPWPRVSWAFPHQLSIKRIPQALSGHFPNKSFLLQNDTSQCQFDIKLD